MAITYATLQDNVDKLIGDYHSLTTTAAGATTILVASAAGNYWASDAINNWYAEVTGTSANGQVRQIVDFDATSGTIQVRTAYSTTPGISNTVKIKQYDPAMRDYALADACREVYPDLHTVLIDDTLVTNNVLLNSNFEDWPSTYSGAGTITPTSWVCGGGGTATRVTGRFGSYALRHTAADYAADYIYQSSVENPALLDLRGKQLTMRGWFYCNATSTSGIVKVVCVDQDGTSTTQATTITPAGAAGEWNEFEFSGIVFPGGSDLESLQSVSIQLWAGANGTSDWDNLYLCDYKYEYPLPAAFTSPIRQAWVSDATAAQVKTIQWYELHGWRNINDNGTLKIHFDHAPAQQGYKLRLVGVEPLVLPSSTSSSINISTLQAQRLTHLAASLYFERLMASPGNRSADQMEKNRNWFRARADALKHIKMQPPNRFLEVK